MARDIARGKYSWLQEMDIATVLDIGANTGAFAEMMRQILPQAMIYSFEPLESCYKQLISKAPVLRPMQCFQFALGQEHAIKTMYRNDYSPSSSLLPMGKRVHEAFPFTRHAVEEQIVVRSLDEVAGELFLKKPILLKADVQGYELNVLTGAEKTLPMIDILILETSFVELYVGQPLFDEVYQFLHDRRFSYSGSLGQILDPSKGVILQEDSIFVRR
ncbi:MAG: FkbM family methyltransferase [Ignavibacteriales bacterium]|nr:FkbM family methyltransferase [Ignavibacteriales bacterium]